MTHAHLINEHEQLCEQLRIEARFLHQYTDGEIAAFDNAVDMLNDAGGFEGDEPIELDADAKEILLIAQFAFAWEKRRRIRRVLRRVAGEN